MYYEEGIKTACTQFGLSKHAYGILRNIGGAVREGVGYLTPQAKSTLLGALAGSGIGAATGALSNDVPGGALGGALIGATGGGAAGRLAPTLAQRFGKSQAAARMFGRSANTGRPATREDLLRMLKKQGGN